MVEHVGRKVALIVLLTVASVALLVLPERPLRLGLDLAGGTRLVYSLDFEEARRSGAIDPSETDAQVLDDTIAIVRSRMDPTGVLEPIIRASGTRRIEIQLPGGMAVTSEGTRATLASTLDGSSREALALDAGDKDALTDFPGGGGVVTVGSERIRYQTRVGNELRELVRGVDGTEVGVHAAGEDVVLASDDAIRNAIENLGELNFYIAAKPGDFVSAGTAQETELQRAKDWAARPDSQGVPFSVYNALPREQGGPPSTIRFFPRALEEGAEPIPVGDRLAALMVPPEKWRFSGDDLARVSRSQDQTGYPAVGFEMKPSARIAFGEFTSEHKGEDMAIVLNDEVVSLATIQEALLGQAQVHGRFTVAQVESLVRVLRSGSLKIKPALEQEERVGATLGQESVRRGFLAGIVGLVLVVAYMCSYYRLLGVFASLALMLNMLMLLGAMSALRATLTLPGIAGIILTIGMAVDANILIFERIREEAEKGHKTPQAAINGFKNALSAIVDGNLATLISAVILMNLGTGPVRGFAVTLTVGILTSMFAALVTTRLLVHMAITRGVQRFPMGRWLANANFDFMGKTKYALVGSAVAIIAGLTLFFSLPDGKKLGIDFLGGASVKVRTEASHSVDEIRALVAKIPGNIGASAEVVALPASRVDGDLYRVFRITFKTEAGEGQQILSEATVGSAIRSGLASVLQKGPVEVAASGDRAQVTVYFEDDHSVADVESALSELGLSELAVEREGQRSDVYSANAKAPPGFDPDLLRAQIQANFERRTDSTGKSYTLAQPIPETTVVGQQVVGELRDSAIKAILLSLFLIVLYIRLRFAEYSYGLAAVAAVAHDVLTTLGALAVMDVLGWVDGEINLPIIAAFLTIIGYSLNDTIVIFDRVRENLPRVKGSLVEIVNLSINQTLARTIMTSTTVLITLIVLFAFSFGTGSVLEGFCFAMIFGLFTGSYSTIYIATPIFVWLEQRAQRKGGAQTAPTAKKAAAEAAI